MENRFIFMVKNNLISFHPNTAILSYYPLFLLLLSGYTHLLTFPIWNFKALFFADSAAFFGSNDVKEKQRCGATIFIVVSLTIILLDDKPNFSWLRRPPAFFRNFSVQKPNFFYKTQYIVSNTIHKNSL